MKQIDINSFEDFNKAIISNFLTSALYRGQRDIVNYKLIPSLGRYFKYFSSKNTLFYA